MRNSNNGSGFFWIIFLIFIFGGGLSFLFPILLVLMVVTAVTFAAVNSSNKAQQSNRTSYRTGNYYRTNRAKYSAAEMAKINVYLRSWFRTRSSLPLGSNIELRIRGQRYASLASLDVYRNNSYICSLNDFGRRYPDSYDEILNSLHNMSMAGHAEDSVIDVEVTEAKKEEPKKTEPKKQETAKGAQGFIDQINALNDDIPDEAISNGLYETCALLKQIQILEEKFPASTDKLKKLYDYYLPILIRILRQYDNLQAAQMDPSYEETKEKLGRTITLINDAMKTIISSLTDQDFINLSADISTLEAVLQKDGLTSDSQISKSGNGGLQ